MNLPHEELESLQPEEQPIEEQNKLIDAITKFRSSNAVIQLAHLINVVLTFIFGYRYMPEVFNIFGEVSAETQTFLRCISRIGFNRLIRPPLPCLELHCGTSRTKHPTNGYSTDSRKPQSQRQLSRVYRRHCSFSKTSSSCPNPSCTGLLARDSSPSPT